VLQNLFAGICLWVFGFFVLSLFGAHQRIARTIPQSHQRHEHRDANGHLRDILGAGGPRQLCRFSRHVIGGVVCIAAAIAGALRRIENGYLVVLRHSAADGASRGRQRSTAAIAVTLNLIKHRTRELHPTQIPVKYPGPTHGGQLKNPVFCRSRKNFGPHPIHSVRKKSLTDSTLRPGQTNPNGNTIGLEASGKRQSSAPQPLVWPRVINGILNQRLPWRLVLMVSRLVIRR